MKKTLSLLIVAACLWLSPQTLTAQVTIQQPEVTVNVETPGTLGDLILQQTENLTDVVTLHVGGTINDADVKTLQDRLTRLRNLDALQLQLTDIPEKFMYNHDTLRTVVLPAATVIVRKQAFSGCDSLKQVTLNDGLTELEASVFASCKKLGNTTLPQTLKTIGANAFDNCTQLTKVVLPEGLEKMGESAFYRCESLAEVTLPGTLKVIPAKAFMQTYELLSLTLPEGIEEIGANAFAQAFWRDQSHSGDKEIQLVMPSTLRILGANAFDGNRNLVAVTLNEGLQSIGQSCFQYAPLTEVTLPSTVSYARAVFTNCNNLKRITCLSVVPPANYDYNLITGSNNTKTVDCTLAIPNASIIDYKQTVGYDRFATYEALDYLPATITVGRDFRFTVPADAPKMDITLLRDEGTGSSDYNGMGTLRLEGDNALSVGRLSMYYDPNGVDWGNKYSYYNNSTNPWGTNAGTNPNKKKGFTSIIANTPWSVEEVEQTFVLPKNFWVFTSLPFDAKVSDIEILNDRGGQFVIREYDGEQRAAANSAGTWHQLSAANTLEAGRGYIINGVGYHVYNGQATSEALRLRFHSKAGGTISTLCSTDDVTIPLTDYPAEFEHNRGWQLVGNPYPCYVNGSYVDFSAPITIWNIYNSRYEALRLTDDVYVFSPFESFFVQYSDQATDVTFHKEGRQIGLAFETAALQARQYAAQQHRKVYNVLLQQGDDSDRTRFVINPDATIGYEADKDAAFMAPMTAGVSSLYTLENGIRYAINERPEADGTIALGLQIATDGTYTLALQTKESDDVLLIDQQEQTTIRLNEQDYTFTAKAGTTDSRFLIKVGNATGISTSVVNSEKVNNGIYNLAGQRVTNPGKGVFIQNGKVIIINQ